MLSAGPLVMAHAAGPVGPHDLAWWLGPGGVLVAVAAMAALWVRGSTRGASPARHRRVAAVGAGLALAVAVSPPVEHLAATLAAGHMVQHVLLLVVAAPLLALARPGPVWLRAMPRGLARRAISTAEALPAGEGLRRAAVDPVVVWLLLAAVTWTWHAATMYDAAVAHPPIHAAEHATMLLAAWAFWRVAAGAGAASHGVRLLMVATMGIAMSLLSALLSFSTTPWYEAYLRSAPTRGLTPLVDQQVAGAIMWVPGGAVHALAAVGLLLAWLRESEAADGQPGRERRPVRAADDRRSLTDAASGPPAPR